MSARILVVDDNPVNVKLLAAKLSKDYYAVLTADDGHRALELAKREIPDLILLDVMMPDINGFDVCTQLKADPATQHIPVVMVTALSDLNDRVRGLECGADDFITKPINDMALFARVRSLLRLKMIMDEWRMREATAAQFALPTAPEQPFAATNAKILLLENEPHDKSTITQALGTLGLSVTAVESLEEVLDKTKDPQWDLVLLSLNIGTDKGLSLCAQLRAQESTRNLPILVLAQDAEISFVARALDLGANDYLIRPIESAELKARTHTQLRQKHHYDQLRRNYENNMALALVDPLTGAYNRRYLDMHLPMLWARCKATSRPLSVLSIDLDHFKAVNDTYGHAAGDAVLKDIINRCLVNLRPSDLVVRMGGEEFAVIMPETNHKTAMGIGERLREAIAAPSVPLPDGTEIPVTSSFGVASINHEKDSAPSQLLDRADAALYLAKNTGRNKVVGEDAEQAP